jgi:WD40 repeat protein
MKRAMIAAVVLLALPAGCSNLVPAEVPRHSFGHAHDFGATAVAFRPDGAQLASGGLRGDIAIWRVEPPQLAYKLVAHTDAVRALIYVTPERLVSSGDDGLLVVWDLRRRSPLAQVQTSPVGGIASDGERVFTGHKDGMVRAWRLPLLEPLGKVGAGGTVLALDRHGDVLAVATHAGRVELFSTSLEWKRDLQALGTAHDLRFSPDGRMLLAGSWFRILVWDVSTGEGQSLPTEHQGLVTSVDVSPEGRHLVTLGRYTDSAIRVWNRQSLTVERRYQAHELCGAMIRFSPDGHYMASASDDESVRLYDLSLQPAPRSAFSP